LHVAASTLALVATQLGEKGVSRDSLAALIQDLARHRQPSVLPLDDSVGAVDAAVAGRASLKCAFFTNGCLPQHRFVETWTP
jgi:hypothetical protein